MSGANRTLQFGPATYEVSAEVKGGQLVMADTTNKGKVKPADGTAACLGVAVTDAEAADSNPTSPLNTAWPQSQVAVGYGPGEYMLTFNAAATFGDAVVCDAAGKVRKYDATASDTADLIVGRVTEPGDVASGAVARVRLYV